MGWGPGLAGTGLARRFPGGRGQALGWRQEREPCPCGRERRAACSEGAPCRLAQSSASRCSLMWLFFQRSWEPQEHRVTGWVWHPAGISSQGTAGQVWWACGAQCGEQVGMAEQGRGLLSMCGSRRETTKAWTFFSKVEWSSSRRAGDRSYRLQRW